MLLSLLKDMTKPIWKDASPTASILFYTPTTFRLGVMYLDVTSYLAGI